MANPLAYPSYELRPEHFNETFWFDTTTAAGTQPTSFAKFNKWGVSAINKTGAGAYTLTLGDKWVVAMNAGASLECQAGEFGYATCGKPDTVNKTLLIQTVNGGGTALTDPAAPRRVFVNLTLSSGVARGNI